MKSVKQSKFPISGRVMFVFLETMASLVFVQGSIPTDKRGLCNLQSPCWWRLA